MARDCIRKEERPKIHDLSFHLRKVEKQKQIKSKVNRKKKFEQKSVKLQIKINKENQQNQKLILQKDKLNQQAFS